MGDTSPIEIKIKENARVHSHGLYRVMGGEPAAFASLFVARVRTMRPALAARSRSM
nr:MAG TPA: hypothetical protein [Caudoviricetes sp.]